MRILINEECLVVDEIELFHSEKLLHHSRKRIVAHMEEKCREFEERDTSITLHMKILLCIGINK